MNTITRGIVAAALLAAAPAAAQSLRPCGEEGRGSVVPDLGFSDVSCRNCSIQLRTGESVTYRFGTPPVLHGITGPGQGRLREGDVLVSVDGQAVTSEAGGRRVSTARRGEEVRLTVRRDGRERDVGVTVGERCMQAPRAPEPPRPPRMHAPGKPPAPPAAPRPPQAHAPRPPAHPGRVPGTPPAPPPAPPAPPAHPAHPAPPPAPPAPPAPPQILPEGWFGFGIRCDDCGFRSARHGDRGSFYFGEAPRLESVEPGTPGARAGLRRGDRLTHVDGVALTTEAGARRFNTIRPGQTVTWTYVRDGRAATARATAARRPDAPRAALAPRPAAADQRLRFSGSVGDAEVEVRGAPVTVTRDERTGELVIRSSDLTVRVRPES